MNKVANYIIRRTFLTSISVLLTSIVAERRVYKPEKDLGATLFTIDHKFYGSRTDFEVPFWFDEFTLKLLF